MKSAVATTFAACALTLACASGTPAPEQVAAHSACDRVAPPSETLGAFYTPGNVYSAKQAKEDMFIGRASVPVRVTGADLYVHAQPGFDETYAERVLRCHAATRQAAHPNDPLVPEAGRVTDVTVRSAGDALVVRVVGENSATAEEIWQRARAFVSSGSVSVQQIAGGTGVSSNL